MAVVGGGVSGLVAAWRLRRLGCEPVVIDDQPHVGGRSASGELGDARVTFGGKNIGKRYRVFRQFLRDTGDPPLEHFGINSSMVADGRVRTLDPRQGLGELLRFVLPLPKRDLARFVRLAMAVRRDEANGYLGAGAFARIGRRRGARPTLDEYFSDRFCRLIVRPMTVRLNGAEPDEVPLDNFAPNVNLLFDSFEQVKPGLGAVLDEFERRFEVWSETRAVALETREGAVVGIHVLRGSQQSEEPFDAVVLAVPAGPAADLVEPLDARLAKRLRTVRYFPAAVAIVRYSRDIFEEDVRAFVFPADKPLSNAGAYGVHDRHTVRYTVSGRTAREFLARSPGDEELLSTCERLLAEIVPVDKRDRVASTVRRWPAAYCAYAVDHADFLEVLQLRERRLPGLFLTGDYVRGAALEACSRAAAECADRVVARATGRGVEGTGELWQRGRPQRTATAITR